MIPGEKLVVVEEIEAPPMTMEKVDKTKESKVEKTNEPRHIGH